MANSESSGPPIVFFDGHCGLCDRFITRVIAHPNAARLRVSPLQGSTFSQLAGSRPETSGLDSIQVFDPATNRFLAHSDAVLFILTTLGDGTGGAASFLKLVPRFIRDAGYRFIARIRYKIFGKRDTCRLPSAEERALFLP